MTTSRVLLIVLLCAAIVLWFAGPAGRLAVASGVLLFAPGFLLECALPFRANGPFVRPALWLGLSISLVALLYQWVTAVGLFLSETTIAGLALACALGVAAVLWLGVERHKDTKTRRPEDNTPSSLIALTLLATFGLRLYQIRDLVLPAWVDSVHHALLIRVAIERGQAPIDLYPYLPITRLPYHWGYHVLAAATAQLATVSVPQVMLWQGQGLNALHVLTCAALASYLWRKPWSGVVAGVVVGLVSLMPAFYVSWGRYTQLTGLLLLPPLAIVWQELLEGQGAEGRETRRQGDKEIAGVRLSSFHDNKRSSVVLAAVLLAGLNLVHFRVLLFGLALLAVQTLVWGLAQQPQSRSSAPRFQVFSAFSAVKNGLFRAAAASLGGVLLTVPWLVLLWAQRLAPAVEQPGSLASGGSYVELSPALLWAGENRLLVALALLGGLYGIRRHIRGALVVVLWVAALVVLANPELVLYLLPVAAVPVVLWALQNRRPGWALLGLPLLLANPLLLRLPSSWLVTNDVVAISMFIPLSALIGGLVLPVQIMIGEAGTGRVWRDRVLAVGSIAGLVAAAWWGGNAQRDVLNPATVLANQADVAAIAWATEHTPADARFLVGATSWLPTAERGTDGGWWLLPLAGRWTSTPPVIFDYGSPDYVKSVRERTRQVAQFVAGQEARLADIIARDRITFVYLHNGIGPLTPAAFGDSQHYKLVYEGGGVSILAVNP